MVKLNNIDKQKILAKAVENYESPLPSKVEAYKNWLRLQQKAHYRAMNNIKEKPVWERAGISQKSWLEIQQENQIGCDLSHAERES